MCYGWWWPPGQFTLILHLFQHPLLHVQDQREICHRYKIWGSHISDAGDAGLPGCYIMSVGNMTHQKTWMFMTQITNSSPQINKYKCYLLQDCHKWFPFKIIFVTLNILPGLWNILWHHLIQLVVFEIHQK